ncbi:MAG: endolytic transglycosylase MltG, partial [Wenzhouxiangella sp.]
MRVILSLLLLLVIGLAVLVGGQAWRDWQRFQTAPVNPDGSLNLWLEPGTSYAGLVRQLQQLGLARSRWEWRVLGRLRDPLLKAGEYRIEAATPLPLLLDQLARGQTRQHRLTIVEGWGLARLREELADDPRLQPASATLPASDTLEAM